MKIGLIAPSDAGLVWNVVKPLLDLAMPYSGGRMTIEKLYEQVRSGAQHLWLVSDNPRQLVAAFTTRIVSYPAGNMLSIQFLGGDRMNEWIDAVDDLLARVAKDANCIAIEMTGRKGWSRALPKTWTEEFVSYRRPVLNDQPLSSGTGEPPASPGGDGPRVE